MGVRNYLIDGGCGVGKTTVANELQRRGYHVLHGDRTLAYQGNPETGVPLDGYSYDHHIWDVDKVKSLIADHDNPISFFCGGSRNSFHFIDLFDAVFVLDVDIDTLNKRLEARPEDEFGGNPSEQELIVRLHATKEHFPKGGVGIDSSVPVARVVDEILSKCGGVD